MKFTTVYLVTCYPSPFWNPELIEVLGIFSTKEIANNAIFHKIRNKWEDSEYWATKPKDYNTREIVIDDELKSLDV